ncbi:MAG: glycine cleavage system protein GcvH [Dethiobacter sp.]|jgi:glycine cleavage system H protein|nr:glycine cleavage system protein GcvH [Dethiobacter sp.]
MKWQVPDGVLFTRKHEWVRQEEGNTVAVGISDYAQDKLGSIVFVELPEIGRELKALEAMAVIESVKAVADTYSPVDGTVVEVNEEVLDQPELLNQDPYGAGWMVKIELKAGYVFSGLLNSQEYKDLLLQEEDGAE